MRSPALRGRAPRAGAALGIFILLLAALPQSAGAVPFRPDVLERLEAEGVLQGMVEQMQPAIAAGLNRPPASARGWLARSEDGRSIPDRQAIVILVDFSDKPANQGQYPSSHYSAMLFSVDTYPTGSMRDWYLENSYGQFNVTGAVTLWLRMPQPYSYYTDGQAGFGSYPRNAQKLAEDAVIAANASVDFSLFDNDGPDGIPNSGDDDGYVDALFVVHAGPGREETGSNNDIHSHAWVMSQPIVVDGVNAYGYSMEPENGKRGVFGHEFGHMIGLPDLYDTDYSSSGVGSWCMMSFGSWGNGGLTPVHFLSWCKAQLGFLDPVVPTTNVDLATLPQVETSPTAYKLWTGGYPAEQYFLVENRQRVLADTHLPGDGLIICHVDHSAGGNENENHPLVAVEQADGLNQLGQGGGSDGGDPWPGTTQNRNFTDTSNPNSRDYDGHSTQVAVREISNSGPTMAARITVETSPIIVLFDYVLGEVSGNGDGDIDPGETFDLTVTLYNRGFDATQVMGTLTVLDPGVVIVNGSSSFGTISAETPETGTPPFRATLNEGFTGDAVRLMVRVQSGIATLAEIPVTIGVNDALDIFRWSHAPVSMGYGDQWHLSTQRNHTPGGSWSWKCGRQGAGNYADLLDAGLVTRSLPLETVDAVRFWHWIAAEDDANFTAWDGAIIEVSVDGGAWSSITPDGGYPYTIIPNPASPFPGGTPCFSGTYDWSQVRIDLSALSGTEARLRFRFGSDGYVGAEGWYIDDVTLEGSIPVDVAQEESVLSALSLASPQPNPARAKVALRFVQPAGVSAHMTVLDAAGRRLAGWDFPATPRGANREVRWDGRKRDGSTVASGVYFVRVEAGAESRAARLLWIR